MTAPQGENALPLATPLPPGRLPRRLELVLPDGQRTSVYLHEPPPGPMKLPVLYVHGIQSHPGWFSGSADHLALCGHPVFQMTRRGSGDSPAPRGHADSARQLLGDVEAACRFALDHAKAERLHLLGVSWGGKLLAAYVSRVAGVSPASASEARLPSQAAAITPLPQGEDGSPQASQVRVTPVITTNASDRAGTELPLSPCGRGWLAAGETGEGTGQRKDQAQPPDAAASEGPRAIDASSIASLTLIAPGLVPQVDVCPLTKLAVAACLVAAPRRPFDIPLGDVKLFTDNPALQDFLRGDPMALHKATARFLYVSRQLDRLLARAKAGAIAVPTTLILAHGDRIIDNARTGEFVARLTAGRCTVRELPGAHTLEFEEEPLPFYHALEEAVGEEEGSRS